MVTTMALAVGLIFSGCIKEKPQGDGSEQSSVATEEEVNGGTSGESQTTTGSITGKITLDKC